LAPSPSQIKAREMHLELSHWNKYLPTQTRLPLVSVQFVEVWNKNILSYVIFI